MTPSIPRITLQRCLRLDRSALILSMNNLTCVTVGAFALVLVQGFQIARRPVQTRRRVASVVEFDLAQTGRVSYRAGTLEGRRPILDVDHPAGSAVLTTRSGMAGVQILTIFSNVLGRTTETK